MHLGQLPATMVPQVSAVASGTYSEGANITSRLLVSGPLAVNGGR
ncbi:hypothetical protein CGRA01v4_04005 [Colletotrichum graminicola]|nr:hypothetical protein CGRA01v4_04005 [Colletotrichum graminicola]